MSSQAQIQAAEKFKAPEASAITGKEAEEETAAADGGEESEGEEVCGRGERGGEGGRKRERRERNIHTVSIHSQQPLGQPLLCVLYCSFQRRNAFSQCYVSASNGCTSSVSHYAPASMNVDSLYV